MQGIHEHCRDWYEDYKETIEHALKVSYENGISGIVDEPNTDPAIISLGLVRLRLRDAYNCYSPVKYRLLVGATSDPLQIKEAAKCVLDYFPKDVDRVGVNGIKFFAGKSVGDLSVIEKEDQRIFFRTLSKLDYRGLVAVHCEKESEMIPGFWDTQNPISHCYARPEKCEVESVKDIIGFAIEEKFKGHLHIYHVTTSQSVALVHEAKKDFNITCGATPHHLLFYDEMMKKENGILLKVNPALRNKTTQEKLLEDFKNGKIDVLETDHAPHDYAEKTGKVKDKFERPVYMSGIPWLHVLPQAIEHLKQRGVSSDLIEKVSHDNIDEILGVKTPRIEAVRISEGDIIDSYAFNPLDYLRS